MSPQHIASSRTWLGLVAFAALFATWLPVFRDPPRDSFPLSTYPMFSSLIDPVAGIDLAVAIDQEGRDVTLSPELIAGTDEVIVAGSIITQAVRSRTTDALCSEIAERLAAQSAGLAAVEIRTDTHDAVEWYSGNREAVSVRLHSRCDVEPAAEAARP